MPIKQWTGSWTSTSLVLLPPLTKLIGSYSYLYLVLNLFFIILVFTLSWFGFRSVIFTLTIGLCAAFTTYNYHVYSVSGSVNQYFIVSYLFLVLFCQYKLFQEQPKLNIWWPMWGLSMLLFVLSYEGWLDYAVALWVCTPILAIGLYRINDNERLKRLLILSSIITVTAVFYILIKHRFGYGQHRGSESDVVFNYGFKNFSLVIEDVISNFITIFYTTLTTFIPPQFVASNSLWHLGSEKLISLQHGYNSQNMVLVPMNALFLWRYYAGITLAVFVFHMYKVAKKAVKKLDKNSALILIFMTMILFSGQTHVFVKWRPMHSLPYLAYHFYLGVVGLMLLVSYLSKMVYDKMQNRYLAWIILIFVWLDIIFCAFARPPFLSFSASYLGMGHYPDPWMTLKSYL
jgi:CDP-diglyceride synthetase